MQAGDTVTYISTYYGDPSTVKQVTIKKITPSGRIILESGEQFVEHGDYYRLYGEKSRSVSTYITTDEDEIKRVHEYIKHRRAYTALGNMSFRKYPLDVLEQIISILEAADVS